MDWLHKRGLAQKVPDGIDLWLVLGLLAITALVVAVLAGDSIAFPLG